VFVVNSYLSMVQFSIHKKARPLTGAGHKPLE
jgi:hypothetical protein